MTHVHQPAGSVLCGQACLAMLADLDLEEACYIVGRTTWTGPADLASALAALGYEVRPRLLRGAPPPANVRGLLDLRGVRAGHVVVLTGDGYVLDPAYHRPVALGPYLGSITERPHAVIEVLDRHSRRAS